jgi:lipoprotein-releasing system ATP-binding protein
LLQVADLTKIYSTAAGPLTVLSGVSLTLASGDAAAVMGPSGSGKSSLLYILGALEPPTSGTVTLDGRNPFELPPRALAAFRNSSIGFVFQDHCLLPQCTVLENVLVPTLVASPSGDDTARARTLIDQVGLTPRIDHRPGELSGGERQRVAIARALVRNPRLLLCDEPTGNLDRASADSVAALLLDLHRRQNTILVVVTHSDQLAAKLPIRFNLIDRRLHRDGGANPEPRGPDPEARAPGPRPPEPEPRGPARDSSP